MATHEVLVTTPGRMALNLTAVVHFMVESDGKKLGEVKVPRYGIWWKTRGKRQDQWIKWDKFAETVAGE
ncbi:MAG TPA: hypothetical protein DCK98_14545 [Chloroflexi bacterium]|jgi:hypothetical protein|nr:hypothetical protein [Chloroflexota bacterium]HAL28714.1 hypothetical protein [Chloroflexota bacterium]